MAVSSLRETKLKKYNSRRLKNAFIFLNSLSLEGSCRLVTCENQPDSLHTSAKSGIYTNDEADVVDDFVANLNSSTPFQHLKRPNLAQSISVTSSVNVEDELRHQKINLAVADIPLYHGMVRSKSHIDGTKDSMSNVLRIWNPNKCASTQQQIYGKRIVFVTQQQVPYQSYSVIPYTKLDSITVSEKHHSIITHVAVNTNNAFIDEITMGDIKTEVSYSHLLVPESSKKRSFTELEGYPESHWIDYPIDDPELTSGKHRTVLKLPSFMISIIPYAKPSEVKKDINGRFKEKFPCVTITLTKLRSLKNELQEIAIKLALDAAVLALAFLYFEKAVLKTRITKQNRKYIAGACLLLSIKYFDDISSKNIKVCIEAITDQFRLSSKDLLSCELQVLILLEFALVTSIAEVLPTYKRLEISSI